MKKFSKILKSQIKNLPVHEPDDRSWQAIEKHLDFDKKLSHSLKQLPTYSTDDSDWEQIANHLSLNNKKPIKYSLWLSISAAASIMIFVSLWFFNKNINKETITVSEEAVSEWKITDNDNSQAEKDIIDVINEQCNNKSYLCKDPQFLAKKQQLLEVEGELNSLRAVMKNSGSTPSMIKSCIKLENFKSELIKDLLNSMS